ncbi:MAG: hypothetical protein Q9218_007560 [Villophora microphyllina]
MATLANPQARAHKERARSPPLMMLKHVLPTLSTRSTRPKSASILSGQTPLLDPSFDLDRRGLANPQLRRSRYTWRTFIRGWHAGTITCAVTVCIVLLVNLILTIWASVKYGIDGDLGTVHEGSCHKTKNMSLWLHFAINVLGTALLSASNYCMQCLSSPTRKEVDRAHNRNIWLDIGVPSIRNLRHITRKRLLLWILLAISSIPLHLFYNSAVFSTLSAREYDVFIVSPNLAAGQFFNASGVPPVWIDSWTNQSTLNESVSDHWIQQYSPFSQSALIMYGSDLVNDVKDKSKWQKLENAECIKKYGQEFVSSRGDLLAVSPALNDSYPIKWFDRETPNADSTPAYSWVCDRYPQAQFGQQFEQCHLDMVLQDAANWTIRSDDMEPDYYPLYRGHPRGSRSDPVDYCLSQPVKEHCRLQFSLALLVMVIICNATKALCMILMIYQNDSEPLVTLGDAVASFLDGPDPTTRDNCTATKHRFMNRTWGKQLRSWETEKLRWFNGASRKRWLVCNVLCIVALIIAGVLLDKGISNFQLTDKSLKGIWNLGYGTITSQSLLAKGVILSGKGGLFATVLLANLPQLFLSFLYLTYNGLFTCMLLGQEWASYAHHRKPLRVTWPRGEQRSTYRLQLPYTYGIPLIVFSGVLHWLVSQSIFLARVTALDPSGVEDKDYSISTCGYSNIAIITVIIVGFIAVVFGIANGFRKYPAGMPLVGSNSAAISAACHAPKDDVDASVLPVMWGAVEMEGKIGHCCFTSYEVTPPVVGELYAGYEATQKRLDG